MREPNVDAIDALTAAQDDLQALIDLLSREIALTQQVGKSLVKAARYEYGQAELHRQWGRLLKRETKDATGRLAAFRQQMMSLSLSLIEAQQYAAGLSEDEAILVHVKSDE